LLDAQLKEKFIHWEQGETFSSGSDRLINGIPDQIKQVFINLSMNAIEAMQPMGGKLMIDFIPGKNEQEIGVRFHDTGPGIPAEDIPKVFEPFFTTKGKGLGLGLVICYNIIEKHSGRIVVESQAGQGATFTVWLPLANGLD
jgi:signal transduction histidine kinase